MSKKIDIIEKYADIINKDKTINNKMFHKAKLLLKIYRDIVWRTEETIYDIEAQAHEFGGRRIAELMEYLSFEFDGDMDKRAAEERFMCIDETKALIDLVDKSLTRLKSYPLRGDLYFEIITKQYIYKNKYTEREMLDIIGVERTMFYQRKKEAINLLGVILWGYILPPLYEFWAEAGRIAAGE